MINKDRENKNRELMKRKEGSKAKRWKEKFKGLESKRESK